MKGIAIFLVVLAHTDFASQFINLFHMAVFFIIAGYCYHDDYSEDWRSVIRFTKRKLKSLYVPYVSCNMILICLHNLFYKLNIYTDIPDFIESDILHASYGLISPYTAQDFIRHIIMTLCFVDGEQLAGTIWFLRALFEVSILYVMIDFISRKCKHYRAYFICVLSMIIMIIGYLLNINNIHIVTGVEQTCRYFIFFTIGVLIRSANIKKTMRFFTEIIFVLLAIIVLLISNYLLKHALIPNQNSPVFYVTNGVCGGYCLMVIARNLMRSPYTEFVAYIGRNSLYIMLWHFLAFKLVTFCYIKLYDMPAYCLASFPVLKSDHLWIIYTVVGVTLPLAVAYIVQQIKKIMKHQ